MSLKRNTIQRQLIKDALSCLDHPTAEQVYDHVKQTHPTVGKATLYRNLKNMSEEGDLVKIDALGGTAARFDNVLRPHFHGKCRKCGVLWDIEMDSSNVENLKTKVEDAGGFLIEDQQLVFIGLCPNCNERN